MSEYTAQQDMQGRWYVSGSGLPDFNGGTLYQDSRLATKEEAERAAKYCKAAYEAGCWQAKRDIRKALGIPSA